MLELLLLVGSIGYTFSMFVLYMFCYSEGEMIRLASYDRYMGAMVLSQFLILAVVGIQLISHSVMKNLDIKILIPMLGILILLFDASKMINISPQIFNGEPMYDFRMRAEHIQEHTEPENTIFLVSSENCKNMLYLNYYLEDRDMDDRYIFSDVADVNDNNEYWEMAIKCISENDYVYIYSTSENVINELGQYASTSSLKNDQLYKVNKTENELILDKVF